MADTRLTAEQLRALRLLALKAGGAAPPSGRRPVRRVTWRSLVSRGFVEPAGHQLVLTPTGYRALSADGYTADAQALSTNRFCS